MANVSGTRSFSITLLTVCVGDGPTQAALLTAEQRGWATTVEHFTNYISSKRRPHFAERLKVSDGCVALIDFDDNPLQAAASAAYLQEVFQHRIVIIALADPSQPQLVLLAMRAGCADVISKRAELYNFEDAFRRIEQHIASRAANEQAAGSILALLGAKGGVGTTTIAVHLANYLVQHGGKKVLLIDNQEQFGHVCIYLGLDGSACHFQEVVRNVHRLDSELLRGFVATHTSGLDVLSSPDIGQVARTMHPDDVSETLEYLRTEYDFIIVDCAGRLDEVSRAVISTSSQVYVVATPEISAVRDLSRYVDDLTALDDHSKIKVVINRYSSQFAVSLHEIEKAIRLPVSFSIPNSYIELVRSANLGVPLATTQKPGFSSEILRWARLLIGSSEKPEERQNPAFEPNLEMPFQKRLSILNRLKQLVSKKQARNG